jgi:hypothetical protein
LVHLKVFEDVKQASKSQASDGRQASNIMGKARFLCLTRKFFLVTYVLFMPALTPALLEQKKEIKSDSIKSSVHPLDSR